MTSVKLHRDRPDGTQKLNLFELSTQREAHLILVVELNGTKGEASEGKYRPYGLNYQ
jgi:hypothetical protein